MLIATRKLALAQNIASFARGKKLILTLKAEAIKCDVKNGEIPIPGEPVIEGEVVEEYYEVPLAGKPAMIVEPAPREEKTEPQ